MLVQNGIAFVDGAFVRADVRLENRTITEIGQLTPYLGETVRDVQGMYVLPGFVDIHIHAFGGADCMRGEADVRAMSRNLLQTGVAAFMPTTMSAYPEETYRALHGIQRVMERAEEDGATVLGAHMEAPFLSRQYKGAQLEACLQNPSLDAFEQMVRELTCVRMITLAPELPGAMPMIAKLKERGIVTCAAHTAATAEQIHRAVDVGLTQITHLFNAQTPLHHREPGVPGAGLSDDRLKVQVIADGIHLHRDILRIAAMCKGARGMMLISDAMEAAGLPEGIYRLGGQSVFAERGAARLEDGTLAGSTLLMHQAVRNMITQADIAPEKVIPMATSTPADSVGAIGFGRIRVGQAGVLNLMDKTWQWVSAIA